MLVTVCGRRDLGWPSHGVEANLVAHAPFDAACRVDWGWDAHFQVCILPEHRHRLDTGAVGWAPQVCLFVVDVDGPNHVATPEWYAQERPKVDRLFAAHPGGYYYSTTHGYRVVYALPRGDDGLYPQVDSPAAARCWRASYESWLGYLLAEFQIEGDEACKDWTRLYRLPRVVRDGEMQVPEEIGDPEALGTWDLPFADVPQWDASDSQGAEYDVGETDDAIVAAARAELHRLGPAVEGQNGNARTRQAWGILTNDFALSDELARQEMLRYNAQCVPPWEEDALFSTTGPARRDQNWNSPRGRLAARVRLGAWLGQAARADTPLPPAPPPRPPADVIALVRAARARLSRSAVDGERVAHARLGKVLEGRVILTDEELDQVVAATAAFVPAISEDEAVAALTPLGAPERVRATFAAVRAALPPPDDGFIAEFTDGSPPESDEDLKAALQQDEDGNISPTPANITDIMRWSRHLHGRLRFDEISKDVTVDSPAIVAAAGHEVNAIQDYLSRGWRLSVKESQVASTLGRIAQTFGRYNPLAEYLNDVRWDGTPRIGGAARWGKVREEDGFGEGDTPCAGWLVDYLHASTVDINGDDAAGYVAQVGAMWLISAVARALSPGCKVDTVLVLEGSQGRKKSTAFRVIGGEWFFDDQLDLNSKDALQQISAAWIFELAELASLARAGTMTQKAFLSKQQDFFRAPYAKVPLKVARRAVFGGTINPESDGSVDYLKDTTGNRRWWPVRVTRDADLGRLRDDRDQLLAEAVHRFRRGERWWFTREEQAQADRAVAQRVEYDEWSGVLKDWARLAVLGRAGLTGGVASDRWTLPDIARAALGVEVRDLPGKQQRVGRALRAAGFVETRTGTLGRRMWTHPDFSVPTAPREQPRSN